MLVMKPAIKNLGQGKFLLPGVIDAHVHFREPGAEWKEDFASGSAAALSGGVTTILDMPNNTPPITTIEAFEKKLALVEEKFVVNFGLFFGATCENSEELKKLSREKYPALCGIKVYMGSSTGGLLVDNDTALESIFQIAKEKDLTVVVHAEDESMIREGKRMDCECARIATEKAILLREKVGNRLHIAHLSCAAELELVRAHKSPALTCEVAPHHLFFTREDFDRLSQDESEGLLTMNPPLRDRTNQEALWAGVVDGTVDIIATDHAPHTLEEKMSPNPPAGVPGVEFMLPLMLNAVNEGRLSLERLLDLVSSRPAEIFGLINEGSVEVDMNLEKTITRDMVKSKCGWSPYEGMTLKGWPVRVQR